MGNLVVEYYLIKVTIKCKGGALFTTATASAVLIRLQKVTKPKLNSYQINCYCYDCDCCDCDCDRGGEQIQILALYFVLGWSLTREQIHQESLNPK